MSHMRILYCHPVQFHDGQAIHLETLGALRGAGYQVRVVGRPSYKQAAFGGSNRHTGLLRRIQPPGISEPAELAYNIPTTWRLLRAGWEFRPDIVYERYNLSSWQPVTSAAVKKTFPFLAVNGRLVLEQMRSWHRWDGCARRHGG